MSMTLSGNGTITGLVSGGLPDGTVLPADLSTGSPSWDSSGNISFNSGYGSVATAYGCRAWVNFNGTGTVAIRGSGNVSSITDNGTGYYTVNFATSMPDANYAIEVTSGNEAGASTLTLPRANRGNQYSGSCGVGFVNTSNTAEIDVQYSHVSIFR